MSWVATYHSPSYADQSLDRREMLIGMGYGTNFFLYGTNGSKILLQMQLSKLYHMQKLIEIGKACCHFTCTSVGSTFAILASFWHSLRGPSKTYVGIWQHQKCMRIASTSMLDRGEKEPLGDVWNSGSICRFLPQANTTRAHS